MARIDSPAQVRPPQFDRVARFYRALEYLSFGPMLERCRFHPLPRLAGCRRALVLGDGDGRFVARLLAVHREVRADAVDGSAEMLRLLSDRVGRAGAEDRLRTTCADIRSFQPREDNYDLVVTHFFLDCLKGAEAEDLVRRLRPHLVPGALWVVSEFALPGGNRLYEVLARGVIGSLYAAFWLLTGLQVREIPDWPESLRGAGFVRQTARKWLGGLLVSEVWRLEKQPPPAAGESHLLMSATQELHLQSPAFPNNLPGIDPGPLPAPTPTPEPVPEPAPGPPPEPDPMPYPGPAPTPQPVT